MKKLLLILCFFIAQTGFSQDYKNNITTDFSEYLTSIVEGDYEKAVSFIDDDLFELIPKEQIIVLMEQTMNNPEISFAIKDPKILSVGDTEHIEGRHYSLIVFSNNMHINFQSPDEETTEEHKTRIQLLTLSFQNNFGADNVQYNAGKDSFIIYVEKEAFAISANGETAWKFLVLERDQKILLEKLLPGRLLEKI